MRIITEVTEKKITPDLTVLQWSDDAGYFGEITCSYTGRGGYVIDAEYLSLETVAAIMKKWIETKKA